MKRHLLVIAVSTFLCFTPFAGRAADEPTYNRQEVTYGRKFGTALTMDVFAPKKDANRAGVIFVVSGGWYSDHNGIGGAIPLYIQPLIDKGYTVFAVVHGSNPKFAIPEILDDMHRSIRFIRHNAKDYGIDPDRLGVTGGSAGGHLSLMLGCAPRDGDPKAADPIDRESSRLQAVVAFYPPTDFLNWGEKGKVMLGSHPIVPVKGAFQFSHLDPKTNSFDLITDEAKREEIGREISPITHVAKDNPPTLVVHGDKDALVPLQQAETLQAKEKEVGATFELIVKAGGGHDGILVKEHLPQAIEWFDKYLAKKETAAASDSPESAARIAERFSELPGEASFQLKCLDDGKVIAASQPDKRLAIGSAFKLYVLATLVDRQVPWEKVVKIEDRHKSLPSGEMQNWPAGSPVTVHTLALKMISLSDNTATDHLLATIGREEVEKRFAQFGMKDPAADTPLLATREWFRLKSNGRLRKEFLAADTAGRRKVIDSMYDLPRMNDEDEDWNGPLAIDTIEWFASAADLCRVLDWLDKRGGQTAQEILAVNPSTAIPAGKFPYAGYKSGSESGVLSQNWLLHTRDGKHFALSAIWNCPAKDAVSRAKLAPLLSATADFLLETHNEPAAAGGS
jgi:acetyl esterase/lipase